MTSPHAALDGGAGSMLAIWSLIVVVIGASLFGYSIVITMRGRRDRRRRRRGPSSHMPRPLPPPPASRPMPLPSGPMVGGMPVVGRPGMGGPRGPASGLPGSRPLALPAASTAPPRYPPQPAALPSAPTPLPSGPVAGGGYAQVTSIYGTPGQPPAGGQRYGSDIGTSDDTPKQGTGYGGSFTPGYGSSGVGTGATYSSGYGPAREPTSYPPPSQPASYAPASQPTTYQPATQPGSYEPASQPSGYASTPAGAPAPPVTNEPTSYVPLYSGGEGFGASPSSGGVGNAAAATPQRLEPPATEPEQDRPKSDECVQLRAECEQLKERAAQAATAAATATQEAEATQADYALAARLAEEARRTHGALVREAAEVAAQIAALEKAVPTPGTERIQQETSHAAFSAFRRGDISSEQLREVFRRAEGWTPEHDRLSKRSTELRTEEADAARARIDAERSEQNAADRARSAAVTARALDEAARDAAADARGRCAAAEACEQRTRRR